MVNGWKVTAIIFICLFFGLISLCFWGYSITIEDEKNLNDCYYNICGNYEYADYIEGVCSCYIIDEDGNYKTDKTRYKT